MGTYLKVVAGVLIAVFLGFSLGKDMSALLSMAVCAMGLAVALEFARPVLDLIRELETYANLPGESTAILLKVMAISLLSEICSLICADSGSGAMGKMLQMLSYMLIIWLSMPLFQTLIGLIRQILGGV